MYNLRQRLQFSGSIRLSVDLPKDLSRDRVYVQANLTDTFLHVFNEQLHLGLNPNDGYYVCRKKAYVEVEPRDGKGWECELDEEVGVFVNKFWKKTAHHIVVLCKRTQRCEVVRPSTSSSSQPPCLTPEVEIGPVYMANIKFEEQEEVHRNSSPISEYSLSSLEIDDNAVGGNNNLEELDTDMGRIEDGSRPSTSRGAAAADVVVNEGTGDIEMEESEDHEERQVLDEWGSDFGNVSLATGVEGQLRALNQKGISVDEVRAKMEQQMRNCSNKIILGTIDDVIKLQNKPWWEDLVQKYPSLGLFLSKVINKPK